MPKANTKADGSPDPSVKVTVTMPTSLAARIDELAAEQRRTRSNTASLLIEQGLAHLASEQTRQAG